MNRALLAYVSRLGDNSLVIGQRMIELVAGCPELEEELANANCALDYIGQARMLYAYAAELDGTGRDEDDFAFLRAEHEFHNLLLLELPNGHFGDSIARLVLYGVFYRLLLEALAECKDERLAAIAVRAGKEIRYHLRHNSEWLFRLGDGTDESHRRMQDSIDALWRYTGELFAADEVDLAFAAEFGAPDLGAIALRWRREVAALLEQATLIMPGDEGMASGGKAGRHTEHFGYLLAEMQFLQRSYPGAEW